MLGSRKFLIFGIVSAIVFSLVIVGASAEDRVNDEPMLRSLADPVYTFYVTDSDYYQIRDYLLAGGYVSQSSLLEISVYNITTGTVYTGLYADSNFVYGLSALGNSTLYSGRTWGFDDFSTLDFFVNEVGLDATIFESTGEDFVFGGILPLFGAITAIGSSLVTFVTSNTIVLIPIVALVLVLGFGVIRRLVKGV